MTIRMSELFLRTLRDDPADADVVSHKLLVRAGYVRRVAPGIYSWLPLGKAVLENVASVVREGMTNFGAQEVLFPALLPRDYYEATGRWTEYGDTLFRLKDRKGADYLLGPTHEELFTDLVKSEFSSYKDFPISLFQIQTKYRDEARPRAGILRGREFLMKDSYSFDLDDAGLQKSYEAHRKAYIEIFDRLGVKYRIVSAVAGAMGGSASEEFLAPADAGEDTFVACTHCDYAANTEAVTTAPSSRNVDATPGTLTEINTPGTPTIDTLVDFLNEAPELAGHKVSAADLLKNVLVKLVSPAGEAELVAVGVPGDREVDIKRLEAAVAPCEVRMVEAQDFTDRPYLVRGYIGPQGLAKHAIRYLADPRIANGTGWITGANRADHHAVNVTCGRDFTVDQYVEAADVRSGDPCPRCGEALSIDRGIEIGHIFQLGRKYADAAKLDALGPDGKPVRITMGSYGVGVSRLVAVLVEQSHDERGIVWPREIAPADIHVVATGKNDQITTALDLAATFEASGLRVLVDDRPNVSAGVKFADADLLGIPTILVVGRGLPEGKLEIKDRASGERREIALSEALEFVAEASSRVR